MQTIIDPEIEPRIDLNTRIEPVIYARLFLDVLAEQGVQAGEVLAGTGLSPVDLADPKNLMTIAQQIRIYANIAQVCSHPTIGLLQGQQIKPHHHGVWGYAMQTAAYLGQAIRIFNQYFDVAGPIARQIMQVDGTVARWISRDVLLKGPGRRVAVEEMISGNYALCQHLSDGKFKLQELRLDYPAPTGHEAYEDLFQCPVLFDQDMIEMRFDASLLNLKLKYADPETERICEEQCRQLLEHLGITGDIVDRVRKIIYESPCDRRDVDAVASKLCMSSRTLRRHLANSNTSFRSVLNEVRQALAIDYLCSTDISVDEISFLLGYSETSNFRHAFKQWTGESPTGYRKQRRQPIR
jgi:AraC-like DNA-binding protein